MKTMLNTVLAVALAFGTTTFILMANDTKAGDHKAEKSGKDHGKDDHKGDHKGDHKKDKH